MGTKYIVEVEDKPFELLSEDGFTSEKLFRVKGFNSLVFDWNELNRLKPYTAPDLEQVRKEAYEQGRKDGKIEGQAETWVCAKKIAYMDSEKRKKIFGENLIRKIQDIYSASECIEKIRQYEQEQEKIEVGDEVENTQTGVRFIVTHMWVNNHGEKGVSGFNHDCSAFSTALDLVRKTDRYFPEIAAVLEKMWEESNG